jgi:ADP-heptose:LPS heptosyltransferase
LTWAESTTAGLPARWLHAHLTSRDMQKAIPAGVAKAVFAEAIARGRGVVITSGPAETERRHVAQCVEGLPKERLRVISDAGWHQLVALIARSEKYWGADTAPAHVAAAMKKPMLIHYGPSKAGHWRPLHPAARIDERRCACLKNKRGVCAKGSPGACLEGIDTGAVLDWFFSDD